MRKYYDQHLDQFTKRAQAQFRVIKIDPKKVGSNEEAKKLAEDILQRARHGEDFAALAAKYNSDDYLSRKQGDVGWVERGAYANEKLEQAVWKLNPGQVTDVVEYNGAYYIAKLENVKAGSQSSFDDPKVQEHIREVLSKSQIQDLQQRDVQRLRSQAMVVPDKSARELVGPVLELAMQKYPIWRAGK
jgi:peptidyl-prolyl cis-trans isomerase D